MKFEIDDKTGMIVIHPLMNIELNKINRMSDEEFVISNTHNLEQILQAVKKTQEKIVNRQIQELQDSKNIKHVRILKRKYIENKPNYPKIEYEQETIEVNEDEAKQILEQLEPKFKIEKIEQNQKIVDNINEWNKKIPPTIGAGGVYHVLYHLLEGKDIKDL